MRRFVSSLIRTDCIGFEIIYRLCMRKRSDERGVFVRMSPILCENLIARASCDVHFDMNVAIFEKSTQEMMS